MDVLNIELEEKTDNTVSYTYVDSSTKLPVNLTGYSADLQIRPQFGSENIIDELSTALGNITLGGTTGVINIVFKPSDTNQSTASMMWTRAAYDLILTDTTGKRTKVLKGFITSARSSSV